VNKNNYKNQFNPKCYFRWRKVGNLEEIFCFPIKSCGPVILNEIFCAQNGVECENLRDRVFMIVRNGEYITARAHPKLVLISPKIENNLLTLSAPGMEEITIDIEKLYTLKTMQLTTWFNDSVEVVDCGDEIAEWISNYIFGSNESLRLVFYPSRLPKPKTQPRNRPFPAAGRIDQGALQDETSFMLLNQGSIDELNTKLKETVSALRFRPNFVVKGAAAFEEDHWDWIKIGEETIFKAVQPCTRCVFTTINPETGTKNPENQPLKTLQSTRVYKATGPSPVFGIQLGIRAMGNVKVGDEVFVGK
jgi:uncharacterized protein YcbX